MDEPRYSRRELAAMFGISPGRIGKYIHQGLLPPARPAGARSGCAAYYDNEHVVRLRAIRAALARNVTLADLKERLGP